MRFVVQNDEVEVRLRLALPHELIENPFHPHLHAQEVKAVAPQHTQHVDNKPVALFEGELLPVEDGHFGWNIFPLTYT